MDKNLFRLMAIFLVSVFIISAVPATADTMSDVKSWVDGGKAPAPQVMVSGYSVSPEILMPNDEAILTVTLKNTQGGTITNWNRRLRYEDFGETNHHEGPIVDASTTKTYTMDAYIEKAYLSDYSILTGKNVKVYNKYSNVGAIGPDEELDLSFKIKVPSENGIYIVKFFADIEGIDGNNSKGIRYQIPLIVSSTVELFPLKSVPTTVEGGSVIGIEVANTGAGEAKSVIVTSDASDITFKAKEIYVGTLKPGESTTVKFEVDNISDTGKKEAVFKAIYKNGINVHESRPISLSLDCKVQPSDSVLDSKFLSKTLEYVHMMSFIF